MIDPTLIPRDEYERISAALIEVRASFDQCQETVREILDQCDGNTTVAYMWVLSFMATAMKTEPNDSLTKMVSFLLIELAHKSTHVTFGDF
jgi:hypothetical protein